MTLTRRGVMAGLGALASTPALAKAPMSGLQVPFLYRIRVGEIEVTALSDGYFQAPLANFPSAEQSKAAELAAKVAIKLDRVPIPINAFVVNTKDRLTLVDSGIGSAFGAALGQLPRSLRAAGFEPEQIDAVLMTHLHIDHVGGLIANNAAVFPNAELIVPEEEAVYWLDPSFPAAAPERQRPMVAAAVKTLEVYKARTTRFARSARLAPGIDSVPLPGHTPGHTGFMISDGSEQVLIWGDIVHSSFLQFAMPAWHYSADVDKDAAAATRVAMFRRAVADRLLVAGMHLPFPGFGHVVPDGDAYAFAPATWRPQL